MTETKTLTNEELLASRPDIALAIQEGKVTLKWYNSDPPRCELYWPDVGGDKPVRLDDTDQLWSYATVAKRMLRTWRIVTYDMTPKDWKALLAILVPRAEVIDESGASIAAEVLDILESWVERDLSESWSANDLSSCPLHKDGYYYFRIASFEQNALFAKNSRFYYSRYLLPRPKLWEILKSVGGQSIAPRFRKRTIRVWQIPEDFNRPALGEPGSQLSLDQEEENPDV
jgi:hypothetical protein